MGTKKKAVKKCTKCNGNGQISWASFDPNGGTPRAAGVDKCDWCNGTGDMNNVNKAERDRNYEWDRNHERIC